MLRILPKNFSFVDIETTGGSFKKDRIIDIGILRVVNNRLVKTYNSLIDPEYYLPPEITRLTGITQKELEGAPTFTQIKDNILELLEGNIFVAHNADFDYRFLKTEFKRRNTKFSAKRLCTVKISRFVHPEFQRHNLDEIISRHNLTCDMRHRGLGDAKVLWDFFRVLKKSYNQKFVKAIEQQLAKPNIPLNLNPKILKNLPEAPGVYIFKSDNAPLYIGKSKNIKSRIMSHLSSSNNSSLTQKILSQTTTIVTHQANGELEALINESMLIKKLQPIYNKKLRHARQLVVLKLIENHSTYFEVKPEVLDIIDPNEMSSILGVFKSIKQAKEFLTRKSEEYNLCDKLLNLEKTNRHCFGFMLGRCKGACCKKESFLRYNVRVKEAFQRKFKPWPFEGPIVIEEAENEDKKTKHFVDKWCYLGQVQDSSDIENNSVPSGDLKFDVDIYKILASFILSERNQKSIKIISDKNLASQTYNAQFDII